MALASGLKTTHHPRRVASPKQRLEWIDLFRGLAVVGMIETHAGNTFLEASLQKSGIWPEMSYYNGLIAPAFFWILGFVRGLSFHRSQTPKPAWPSVKRLLMILAVGYAMHLPYGFLSRGDFSEQALWSMFMVDVLQCLAISGLMLVLFERMPKLTDAAAGLALLFFVFFTDRAQSWRTGFIPLDAYFTSDHGSLFPLFPWAGFALAGFIASKTSINNVRMVIASILLAFGIRHVPHLDWTIAFFLERLGWVMLLAFIISTALEKLCQRARPVTGWLYLAGRESLVVYVAHLTLIHALPWPGGSLEKQIGLTQPLWVVILLFVGLLLLSLGAAVFNERRKARAANS